MDDPKEVSGIIWTPKAVAGSLIIKDYLLYKFTSKKVDNFFEMLSAFEKKVIIFPEIYPISVKSSHIRRAVLSKQLSIFYIQKKGSIRITA